MEAMFTWKSYNGALIYQLIFGCKCLRDMHVTSMFSAWVFVLHHLIGFSGKAKRLTNEGQLEKFFSIIIVHAYFWQQKLHELVPQGFPPVFSSSVTYLFAEKHLYFPEVKNFACNLKRGVKGFLFSFSSLNHVSGARHPSTIN